LWGDDPTPHSQERREMAEEVYSRGKIEDDIRAGRPEGYFDYIYKTERFFRRGAFKASKHFASSYGKFWRSETNAAFSFPPKDSSL